jgi:hypothetical protein
MATPTLASSPFAREASLSTSPSPGPSPRLASLSLTVTQLRSQIESLGSILSARHQFGQYFSNQLDGVTHHGARDLYASCGYPRNISPYQYIAKFKRNGVARRAIRIMPSLTWGSGIDIVDDPSPDNITSFERDWQHLQQTHQLNSRFYRSDVAMRLGEFAVLYIGAAGDPATELPVMRGPQDVKYFATYTQARVRIKQTVTDITNPRYGQVELYEIIPSKEHPELSGDVRAPQQDIKVHWSRIIHLCEGALESEIYGTPALESLFNLIIALEYVTHSGGEAAWQRANPGTHVNFKDERADQSDPFLEDAEIQDIEDQVKDLQNGLRRFMVTVNGEVDQIGGASASHVSEISHNAESILQQIALSLDMPMRRFMGSERGNLASSQDQDATDDLIGQRRREFGAPAVHSTLNRLVQYGAMAPPVNPLYQVSFNEADEMNQKEIPAAIQALANANLALKRAGLPPVLLPYEMRDMYFHQEPLTDEQLAEVGYVAGDVGTSSNGIDNPTDQPLDPTLDPKSQGDASLARSSALWRAAQSQASKPDHLIRQNKLRILKRSLRDRALGCRKVRSVFLQSPRIAPERLNEIVPMPG